MRINLLVFALVVLAVATGSDGPQDNIPDKVRRIPPPGIKIPPNDCQELENSLSAFQAELAGVANHRQEECFGARAVADVQIFCNAAHYALKYDEFFQKREIDVARNLLKQGRQRAIQLRDGKAP